MRTASRVLMAATSAAACAPVFCRDDVLPIPPSGVIGTQDAMLSPDYWVARTPAPDQLILTRAQIDTQNARLFASDSSMYDLRKIGPTLARAQVLAWVTKVSKLPSKPLMDVRNQPIPKDVIDTIVASVNLDAVPASESARYGMAVHLRRSVT